ncbi:MAG: translation initiation factor IF-1 [Candidatus Shikimatogenerans bostrichidophilus]|nr:MAG: translation initiation factor IF-1 [Candidatus Shikimatogenerans bostrichidophilus]
MVKQKNILLNGKIIEALPNAMFKVKIKDDYIIIGHISGKIRRNYIKILPGDKVQIEISPYDIYKGRIKYRY